MAIRRKLDVTATLCLLAATVCWGSVPVMLKYLTADIHDGFTTNAVRYPLSAIIYLPFLVMGIRRGMIRGFWLAALLPTSINIIGQSLWAWVPFYLPAGLLAFLFRLATVFGIIGAFCVFRDERRLARSWQFWVGSAMAALGFVGMAWVGLRADGGGATMAGVVMIVVCALCYGLYGVTVRYTMKDLHPLVAFSVISLYTSIALIAMAPVGEPTVLLDLSPFLWGVLVLSGLMGVAAAHGLYYIAVQRIGVAVSALTLMATPFISIAGSAIVFQESFSTGQWVGGMVLVGGSALALLSQQHIAPPEPAEGLSEETAQP